ncbi:hypothetical protein ACIRPH_16620 [Nocardiopsis sp. NPDC101807]|uniref:hypothetical protein n=1 Tax=Nocardiopsis sp. NPDC101807 TaxID=3364339 RepID=UPI00380EB36B
MTDPLTWAADVHGVPWDTLEDLDGAATGIADLLVQAFDPSEQEAVDAVEEIADRVDTTVRLWVAVPEPDVLTSSVPALLPFLVRIASDRDRPDGARVAALNLVADLADLAHRVRPEHLDPAWPAAWADQGPRVEALLGDPRPSVLLLAVDALAREPRAAPRLLRALRDRWEAVGGGGEGGHGADGAQDPAGGPGAPPGRDGADTGAGGPADRRTRLRLLTRAVRLSGDHPGPTPPDIRSWLLDRGERGDLDERMVVAFASPALVPEDPLPLVLEGVAGEGSGPAAGRQLWLEVAALAPTGDALRVRYGLRLVAQALAGDRPGRERIVDALIDHPSAPVRLGAVRLARDLVAEYRSAGERWAGPAGALLDDPDPGVRTWSLRLLAVAGGAAGPCADRLAALAEADGEGADTALLTLALVGDARAAALLLARADRPRFGFGRGGPHHTSGPGLEDVLGRLPAHADVLLPLLRERLRSGGADTEAVLRSLAGWGEAAAPLADDVAALLDDRGLADAALRVLAGIGPAAAAHADRVPASGGVEAARAHHRLTGDAGAALDLLGPPSRRLVRDERVQALLDGIGPPADGFAPLLRDHLEDHLRTGCLRETRALSALWSTTGDTPFALRCLLSPRNRVLTTWAATRVGPPAVRLLGRIGPPAAEALPLLRALRDSGRSALPSWTDAGWRDALRDRRLVDDVREAVGRIGGG